MAANMDTKIVAKIMAEFESGPQGAQLPLEILDAIKSVVIGMSDYIINRVFFASFQENIDL